MAAQEVRGTIVRTDGNHRLTFLKSQQEIDIRHPKTEAVDFLFICLRLHEMRDTAKQTSLCREQNMGVDETEELAQVYYDRVIQADGEALLIPGTPEHARLMKKAAEGKTYIPGRPARHIGTLQR